MSTLYASFVDAEAAEHAAAALLDHGARPVDVSIIAHEQFRRADVEALTAEATAKSGITTTTAADAGVGAAKGSVAGLGLGILGALAALFVPGVGIVIGGGALAAAVAATTAAAVAGAAAGGVAGFLKDQGVGEDLAMKYSQAVESGGAVLSVEVPTGDLSATEIEPYLVKYGALHVSTVNMTRNLADGDPVPLPVATETASIVQVPAVSVAPAPPNSLTSMATVPSSSAAVAAAVNAANIRPTLVDPVTGTMREGVAVDPLTGVERPVRMINGAVVYADMVPGTPVVATPVVTSPDAVVPAMTPVTGFTLNDVTPLEIDPVTGVVTRGTIVDPVTGGVRQVRVVNGSIVYADVF